LKLVAVRHFKPQSFASEKDEYERWLDELMWLAQQHKEGPTVYLCGETRQHGENALQERAVG
jgi:hypothetical protein